MVEEDQKSGLLKDFLIGKRLEFEALTGHNASTSSRRWSSEEDPS
jgi:hypothetical protein